jgi:hypothetical protein
MYPLPEVSHRFFGRNQGFMYVNSRTFAVIFSDPWNCPYLCHHCEPRSIRDAISLKSAQQSAGIGQADQKMSAEQCQSLYQIARVLAVADQNMTMQHYLEQLHILLRPTVFADEWMRFSRDHR